MSCTQEQPTDSEKFRMIKLDGKFALYLTGIKKYCSVYSDNTIKCDKPNANAKESKFEGSYNDKTTLAIKCFDEKFIFVDKDSKALKCGGAKKFMGETFTIEVSLFFELCSQI
jgi:hypothetical protein